jgi:hypothetical protein
MEETLAAGFDAQLRWLRPTLLECLKCLENSGSLDFKLDLLFTNKYASHPASDNSMSSLGEFGSGCHDDMLFDF